jgi:hypothetical protein
MNLSNITIGAEKIYKTGTYVFIMSMKNNSKSDLITGKLDSINDLPYIEPTNNKELIFVNCIGDYGKRITVPSNNIIFIQDRDDYIEAEQLAEDNKSKSKSSNNSKSNSSNKSKSNSSNKSKSNSSNKSKSNSSNKSKSKTNRRKRKITKSKKSKSK